MAEAKTCGNLDNDSQSKRLRVGVVAASVALTIAVVMIELGAPALARALLVLPFLMAAHMLFQGLHRT
jgi:hypothetical protein